MRKLSWLIAAALAASLVADGPRSSLRGAERSESEKQAAGLKQQLDRLQARIQALEQRVEKLEAQKLAPVQASQAPKLLPPTAPPALVVPRPEALPKNWQPFEFNGMTYYLVPLRQ